MSSTVLTDNSRSRSSLPKVVLGLAILLLLVLMTIPTIIHLRYDLQYRNGRYAQEARQAWRSPDQIAMWMNENASRDATIALNNLMALDFSATGPSVVSEVRNDRVNPNFKLTKEKVGTDQAFQQWDHHLVEQIYALVNDPTPVWMPTAPRRRGELDIRACYWVLALEFANAVTARDSGRAYKAVEACNWLADSVDLKGIDPITYRSYQSFEIRRRFYKLICDSMQADIWSGEQLKDIRSILLRPLDVARRERAIWVALYGRELEASSLFTIDSYSSLERMHDTIYKLDHEGFRYSEHELYTDVELWRRLAILAIAAKQFKLANDAWPKSFIDLQKFDVDQELWENQFKGELFPADSPEGMLRIDLDFTNVRFSQKEFEGSVVVK